jgi:replication initiation protein RepC
MSLSHSTTTPFGRRPASLGQIAAGMELQRNLEAAAAPGSNAPEAVNKWKLFRTLTEVREQLGVSDRALSVLNALLSFHPETALTQPRRVEETEEGDTGLSCDLVVFPSNKALGLRAHGMAEKTLRRHLAALVESGLIIRRDSPNGKRYARKDATGEERFSHVYGFDLTPLVGRAPEFESLAEDLRRATRARAVLKERISLHRRDVAKLIALGLDEGVDGPWEEFRQQFMRLLTPLRRIHDDAGLEALSTEIAALRGAVGKALEVYVEIQDMTGNDGIFDRHKSNSNTELHTDFEPASEKEGGRIPDAGPEQKAAGSGASPPCPLGMVLEACPDVREYGVGGSVRSWPQFIDAARMVRPMLGISPDAWTAAVEAMGVTGAAIAVAVILQRSEYSSEATTTFGLDGRKLTAVNFSPAITSPGGYLRALTDKAVAGEFSAGPVLMALIGQRMKVKRAGG